MNEILTVTKKIEINDWIDPDTGEIIIEIFNDDHDFELLGVYKLNILELVNKVLDGYSVHGEVGVEGYDIFNLFITKLTKDIEKIKI